MVCPTTQRFFLKEYTMPKNNNADKVAKALTTSRKKRKEVIQSTDLLKTGSTLLDMAISGRRGGGFAKGKYFFVVGDSSSGKTFLVRTCLAEATMNKNFDNYRLIFDDVEDGALMDTERYFGKRLADRLESPTTKDGEAVYSATVEDFYYHLDDALTEAKDGKPFIYVLDSMDALGSKYGTAKFQEGKKAARSGKTAKGDYGDGKAKINSTYIRNMIPKLRATGSILIVLSQTRDDIGAGLFDEKKTHAGGHALKFYSTVQIWSSVGAKIKKKLREKDVVIGVNCRVKVKKNRITGRDRTVSFPIYYDVGIDDIGGMVDWLTEWGFWKKSGGFIDASVDFDIDKKRRENLIQWIDENEARVDLEDIVEAAWADIEERLTVKRKSKYD